MAELRIVGRVLASALARGDELAALRASEARYRSVVRDQTEFIVRWLPGGVRTWVNERYCAFFRQTREELLGTSFLTLIVKEDRDRIEMELRALSPESTSRTGEHRVLLPDGGIGWQEWTDRALFDDRGTLVEIQSVGRDITERKLAEAELEQSEARYRAVAESTADWIWEIDLEGRYAYTNARIGDVLRYSEAGLRELSLEALIHPDDFEQVSRRLPVLVAESQGWSGWILRFRHSDGRYRHLQSSAAPVVDPQGTVRGFRGIDRDVTFTVLLSQVSSSLLQADMDSLDACIVEALGDIGAGCALDRSSLWWVDQTGEAASQSHE